MSTAARAIQERALVILPEKAPTVGGSPIYAGSLWTAPTVELMH
jgi:hypothetical protein